MLSDSLNIFALLDKYQDFHTPNGLISSIMKCTECVSLPSIPRGSWYCKFCQNMFQREKFVAHNANAVAAGRVEGVDPIEQITKRCIRIVEDIDTELSGCALCRYLMEIRRLCVNS